MSNLAYSQTIGGVDLSKIPGLQNLTGFNNVPTADNGQGTEEGQGTNNVPTADNGQGTEEGRTGYRTEEGQVQRKDRVQEEGQVQKKDRVQIMYLHWTMLLMNQNPIK